MEEYIAPNRKRIPYGMMNFAVIRRDDCYYVDKTRFIPIIEDADKFFFFIRPRRFGKSLTVSMLQHYYDIAAQDKFDALFGDLYIGKYPTRDRNSYLVLYLNFSGIVSELHNYRKGLDAHCQTMFDYFCDIYADYLPQGIKEKLDAKEGAVEQFEYLFTDRIHGRGSTANVDLLLHHQPLQPHCGRVVGHNATVVRQLLLCTRTLW